MNLYVGNLSHLVKEAELRLLFEGQGLGKVLFMREANPSNDLAKGYAIISLDEGVQAHIAVSALNGKKLKGFQMVVRPIDDHTWTNMYAQYKQQEGVMRRAS